jgi:hypothetical protein
MASAESMPVSARRLFFSSHQTSLRNRRISTHFVIRQSELSTSKPHCQSLYTLQRERVKSSSVDVGYDSYDWEGKHFLNRQALENESASSGNGLCSAPMPSSFLCPGNGPDGLVRGFAFISMQEYCERMQLVLYWLAASAAIKLFERVRTCSAKGD